MRPVGEDTERGITFQVQAGMRVIGEQNGNGPLRQTHGGDEFARPRIAQEECSHSQLSFECGKSSRASSTGARRSCGEPSAPNRYAHTRPGMPVTQWRGICAVAVRVMPAHPARRQSQNMWAKSQYSEPDNKIAAGSVSIQAISRLRMVDICSPDLLAAMVPATPDDSTWVVDTGNP